MRAFLAWFRHLCNLEHYANIVNQHDTQLRYLKADQETNSRHLKDEITKLSEKTYTKREVDEIIQQVINNLQRHEN